MANNLEAKICVLGAQGKRDHYISVFRANLYRRRKDFAGLPLRQRQL